MEVVEIEPSIVELDEIDPPAFKLSDEINMDDIISNKPSVNFGAGIELLMNDKNRNEKKASSNIDIDDITNLEDELNDLTNNIEKPITEQQTNSGKKTIFSGLFGENQQ